MAWLKQAVAAGYNDAATIKKDKDLDVLRDRGGLQGTAGRFIGADGPYRPGSHQEMN